MMSIKVANGSKKSVSQILYVRANGENEKFDRNYRRNIYIYIFLNKSRLSMNNTLRITNLGTHRFEPEASFHGRQIGDGGCATARRGCVRQNDTANAYCRLD